jgi:uncharacterized membrane protein
MKRLTYLACTLVVSIMVAAMAGWSMAAGNFLVPVCAIPLGIIVILACRRNVREVIGDERSNKVRSRAALRTLEVVIIAGAIAAVILYSYLISSSLMPAISGRVYANGDGTSSMVINMYYPGGAEHPGDLIRSTTIRDINAMNQTEAMEYCQYRSEAFQDNEQKGLVGMTIWGMLAALLVSFGAFYLYYDRKY